MLNKLCVSFINIISTCNNYTDIDREKMVFALESFLGDLSKTLILFVAFVILGYGTFFIVVFTATVLLRSNIGGFHAKTYWGCFLFSTSYFTALCYMFTLNLGSRNIQLILVAISILIQLLIAPVTTPQREAITRIDLHPFKIKAMVVSTTIAIIHIIINNPYTLISTWVVIIQTLLIVIYKGAKYYEKIQNCNS